MKPRVIISVRGGVAELVEATDDVDVVIVDWDNWNEDGKCCICSGEINNLGSCEECGTDYNSMNARNVAEYLKNKKR